MIHDVTLEFLGCDEPEKCDDLFDYHEKHDFTLCVSLEAKVDTTELTLSFLGDTFPNLQKLRLNNSVIPNIRDVGCTLTQLRFLSLARCNITSLDGISTISQTLEELYLAYNSITEISDLIGMSKLKIIDLEENQIDNINNIEILALSPNIISLTLCGNPCANSDDYRDKVAQLLPSLVYLDEKKIKRLKTPRPPKSPPSPAQSIRHSQISRQAVPSLGLKESIMTEQLLDEIDDRPPTSRGVRGFDLKMPQPRLVISNASPRIVRPISSRGSKPI